MPTKFIAWYEDQWMAPGTDWAQWDHLARAYGCSVQMIRDWSEAVVPEGAICLVAAETGTFDSRTYEWPAEPAEIVVVFGRSGMITEDLVPGHDGTIRVDTPVAVSLFGVVAGAILMRDRWQSP